MSLEQELARHLIGLERRVARLETQEQSLRRGVAAWADVTAGADYTLTADWGTAYAGTIESGAGALWLLAPVTLVCDSFTALTEVYVRALVDGEAVVEQHGVWTALWARANLCLAALVEMGAGEKAVVIQAKKADADAGGYLYGVESRLVLAAFV